MRVRKLAGEVFQIKDDYIDYFEVKDKTGKTPLKDFTNGLFTYPAILLLETSTSSEKKQIASLIQKSSKTDSDKQEILQWMEKKKIQAILLKQIENYRSYLLEFLSQYANNSYRKIMEEKIIEVL